MIKSTSNFLGRLKLYEKLILTLMISVFLYIIAAIYNDAFMNLVSIADYLTWHIIFEFTSILVAFSIFTVTFFVYEESANLRMIILGSSFLVMGLLDAFHTFSFAGMPEFFVPNLTANRATTLWILARSLGGLGILIAMAIPRTLKSNLPKKVFAIITTGFSILLFIIVTYYPNLLPSMHNEDGSLSNLKIIMEYIIILIMIATFLVILYSYNKTSRRIDHQFMVAIIFLVFSEFSFTNYGSVYDVYNYIGHIYKVIAFSILYRAIYVANVSEPYREMKKARNKLRQYSKNLNKIVAERTNELVELNSNLMKDIEYAREMQLRLLPEELLQEDNLTFSAEYLPAERLSGDFYNVIKLDEENLAIYIGDVSGHGVAAAMLTVFASQHIMPFKEVDNNPRVIADPSKVLSTVYKGFNDTNFDDSTYIIMLYGIYNKRSKVFTYSSAGLNVDQYVIKNTGEVVKLNTKGFAICKLGEYITPKYEEREIQLESGDKLLLYSDGLIESKDKNGEFYGQEKMKSFLEDNHSLNGSKLKKILKNDLFEHMGAETKIMDDITFLIMEVD